MKKLILADKSTLKAGDIVYTIKGNKQIITEIKNGGAIGEYIASKTHWLSNATLFVATN